MFMSQRQKNRKSSHVYSTLNGAELCILEGGGEIGVCNICMYRNHYRIWIVAGIIQVYYIGLFLGNGFFSCCMQLCSVPNSFFKKD